MINGITRKLAVLLVAMAAGASGLFGQEKVITQDKRQEMFDNYQTTDDHLMHITGTAKDQMGNKYYLVKNSWGTGKHIYKGYHYVSEAYMRAKTIFFMVHKEAVPVATAVKLGLLSSSSLFPYHGRSG